QADSVRVLLAAGADPDRRDLHHRATPLDWYYLRQDQAVRTPGYRIDPEVQRLLVPVTRRRH
ncbi:hypothetical protein ACFQ07_08655, partial [Actinomadura adrarensis]